MYCIAPERVLAPQSTPVSLAEAKQHLRVDHSEEDDLINGLIEAATSYLDGYQGVLGRCLITQRWQQDFEGCARKLELSLPASSVVQVTYDSDVVLSSKYVLTNSPMRTNVLLKQGESWGSGSESLYPIRVTYECGYGSPADVPSSLKAAMLLLIGNWYINREQAVYKNVADLPHGVQALLNPYRVYIS